MNKKMSPAATEPDDRFLVVENITGFLHWFNTGEEVGIFMLGKSFNEYSIYVRVDRPYTIESALSIQLERINTEC